jgi:hypothetical protein
MGMFMISWYAFTKRLRTSVIARNETLAFCISSMTCGSSTPGTPRSNCVGGTLLRLVHLIESLLQHVQERVGRRLHCAADAGRSLRNLRRRTAGAAHLRLHRADLGKHCIDLHVRH